ncbi:MAG: DEAD/DEAH box helicase [Candidatus Hodarchaeales archaeon]
MNIKELPLPSSIIEKIQSIETFSTLYPPQAEAVNAGLFNRENLLVAIPTASGKTFIAELCALQHILVFKTRVLYLSPLRALASEKYQEFRRFHSLGVKVGVTTGDLDSSDFRLSKYDFLVATNEKVDSLLRHRLDFIEKDVSLLIIDECHLLDDPSRGPTLETLLVKIQILNPNIQILALSATVKNAEEIATWINATSIQTTWRPIPLKEAYCTTEGELIFRHGSSRRISISSKEEIPSKLVEETLSEKGQVLIFAPSRRSAQKTASSLTTTVLKFLSTDDKNQLKVIVDQFKDNNQLDKTSKGLKELIQNGIAFHHAGLASKQRTIIEKAFKNKIIKVVTATPTMAAGVNTPSRRVIITSLWRYSSLSGRQIPIKVLEYEQMAGRAGRPQYDPYGEAIVLCSYNNDRDVELIQTRYFSEEGPEPIESKLAAKPALRIHILGTISTGLISTYRNLKKFLEKTLFGFQYGDISRLETILRDVLADLTNFGFLKLENSGEHISITKLGKRVSQLYIDPVTANTLIHGLGRALTQSSEWEDISFLHLFCHVPDIRRLSLRKSDWKDLEDTFNDYQYNLLTPEVAAWSLDYQRSLEAYRTAKVLKLWINEKSIPDLLTEANIQLGDLHRLLETIKWINYSTTQLCLKINDLYDYNEEIHLFYNDFPQTKVKNLKKLIEFLKSLEMRLEFGIKQDLLPLVNLKGIGRVKARTLVAHNIKTPNGIRDIPIAKLLRIQGFGPTLSKELKAQVGETVNDQEINSLLTAIYQDKNEKTQRKNLFDFLID